MDAKNINTDGEVVEVKSLEDTWKYCLEMWKWISEQIVIILNEGDINGVEGIEIYVEQLKADWLKDNGFKGIVDDCFFCDYAGNFDPKLIHICSKCPAAKIENNFNCGDDDYSYSGEPIKFYNKLVELNELRLSYEPE